MKPHDTPFRESARDRRHRLESWGSRIDFAGRPWSPGHAAPRTGTGRRDERASHGREPDWPEESLCTILAMHSQHPPSEPVAPGCLLVALHEDSSFHGAARHLSRKLLAISAGVRSVRRLRPMGLERVW